MKKTVFIFIAIAFISSHGFSQEEDTSIVIKKMANDQFIIDLNYNTWLDAPGNVTTKPLSLGINIYLMKPLVGKKSNFSIAAGLSLGSQNVNNNSVPYDSAGVTYFNSDTIDNINYKKNKFTTIYVDVPVELRLRTNQNSKEKSFKISAGFKIGYLISSYTKYVGDDYRVSLSNDKVKFKEYRIKNILQYRYGVYARIGYGNFNLTGYYALTPLFEKNKEHEIIPVSVGISIILL